MDGYRPLPGLAEQAAPTWDAARVAGTAAAAGGWLAVATILWWLAGPLPAVAVAGGVPLVLTPVVFLARGWSVGVGLVLGAVLGLGSAYGTGIWVLL